LFTSVRSQADASGNPSPAFLSDSGLPLLSGQCTPLDDCGAAGYLMITPEQLRDNLYRMLYDCNGSYALSPTRCNNFVYLASATLKRDKSGRFCLTEDGELKIYQLAAAILPDFPGRVPVNTKLIPPPGTPLVRVHYSASRTEVEHHIKTTRKQQQLGKRAQRTSISSSEFKIVAAAWRSFKWNGYALDVCKDFPSYSSGTTAYAKCAALICANFGMPDDFTSKMNTCCQQNLQTSDWDWYCYRDPVQHYEVNTG